MSDRGVSLYLLDDCSSVNDCSGQKSKSSESEFHDEVKLII